MVKLICVVAVHVYTERCIDVLNVFKLNYTGNKTMLLEVSLIVALSTTFLNVNNNDTIIFSIIKVV